MRIRERFLASDPPAPAEVADASRYIDDLLDASGISFDQVATFVGVGGTATSLAALALRLPVYDSARVHGSVVAADDLAELTGRLLVTPVREVLALPTMVPGRADVICAGGLICRRIAARVGLPLRVSETDILDGIILGLAARAAPQGSRAGQMGGACLPSSRHPLRISPTPPARPASPRSVPLPGRPRASTSTRPARRGPALALRASHLRWPSARTVALAAERAEVWLAAARRCVPAVTDGRCWLVERSNVSVLISTPRIG